MKKNLYPACPSDFLLCYTGEKLQRDDGAIINHLVLASKRGPFVVTIRNRRNYTIELTWRPTNLCAGLRYQRHTSPIPSQVYGLFSCVWHTVNKRCCHCSNSMFCFVVFFFCIFLKQKSLLVKLSMKALTFVYFFCNARYVYSQMKFPKTSFIIKTLFWQVFWNIFLFLHLLFSSTRCGKSSPWHTCRNIRNIQRRL